MSDTWLLAAAVLAGILTAALLVFLARLDPAEPQDVERIVRANAPAVNMTPLRDDVKELSLKVDRLERQVERLFDDAIILNPGNATP